ncbi:pyridoxamine 5'-phosphate oxidase family protein [Algoriphagus antarcticus]|uniref:General stress protein 26 n=1 Tax=Algoriphagus antarcticus TaxID=238540 RepID=A0A3E0EBS5_9BACT|nr:pyridoxamine 5'-phosphate oxidase family protein [Algoriphagus antarcticus]REG94466.1 general stress protein 26 [Algoriphagus antarcticus]
MSSPEHKQLIWNLIKEIKFGMLVTHDDLEEKLRGRPMSLVQDEYDGTIYFFTDRTDAKAYEIKRDRDVCLTFADKDDQTYVSLSGKANLTEDKSLIDRYWNKWVAAWFPKGKDDPTLAMLEIKIQSGEHWKADENKLVQLFKIAKANLTDSEPEMGDHETFGK